MRYLAMAVLLLAACTTESEKTEEVTVEEMQFQPSTDISGITSGGDFHVSSSDPVYMVVFTCPHGRFAVKGDDGSAAKSLWQHVHKGERMRATFTEKRDSDGKMVGFKFYGAEPL